MSAITAPPSPIANYFTSANQTVTSGSVLTIAHGLGQMPDSCAAYLVCVTAEGGYSVGDRLNLDGHNYDGGGVNRYNYVVSWDATNLYITMANAGLLTYVKTTGATVTLTNANWRLVGVGYV